MSLSETVHLWFSENCAAQCGHNTTAPAGEEIKYTTMCETLEGHGCKWDDMVYLGEFAREAVYASLDTSKSKMKITWVTRGANREATVDWFKPVVFKTTDFEDE